MAETRASIVDPVFFSFLHIGLSDLLFLGVLRKGIVQELVLCLTLDILKAAK